MTYDFLINADGLNSAEKATDGTVFASIDRGHPCVSNAAFSAHEMSVTVLNEFFFQIKAKKQLSVNQALGIFMSTLSLFPIFAFATILRGPSTSVIELSAETCHFPYVKTSSHFVNEITAQSINPDLAGQMSSRFREKWKKVDQSTRRIQPRETRNNMIQQAVHSAGLDSNYIPLPCLRKEVSDEMQHMLETKRDLLQTYLIRRLYVPSTIDSNSSQEESDYVDPQIHMVLDAFTAEGVPEIFALLALVESEKFENDKKFYDNHVSEAGAKGAFQFMPDKAVEYKLISANFRYDLRSDWTLMAMAAAREVRSLLTLFRWNTSAAIAAYNRGSSEIANALYKTAVMLGQEQQERFKDPKVKQQELANPFAVDFANLLSDLNTEAWNDSVVPRSLENHLKLRAKIADTNQLRSFWAFADQIDDPKGQTRAYVPRFYAVVLLTMFPMEYGLFDTNDPGAQNIRGVTGTCYRDPECRFFPGERPPSIPVNLEPNYTDGSLGLNLIKTK